MTEEDGASCIKEGAGGTLEKWGGGLPAGAAQSHQQDKSERVIHYHLLRLAEVDVFHVLAPRLALLDVHDADERHGPAPEEEDGEEHDDDGGGADQLPLLDGLQAQMETQGVGDGATQTYQRREGKIIKVQFLKWSGSRSRSRPRPLTAKPHDEHHFGGDLVISEEVQQEGQREDVHRSPQKDQNLQTET